MRHKHRGFTLIELMVTIAILAIIATIAAPNFQTMYRGQQLNGQAKELLMVLSKARSQALTLRQQVQLHLNSNSEDTFKSLNWMPQSNHHLVQGTTKITITFLPNGTLADFNSLPNILAICDQKLKKTKRIQIYRTGSVSMISEGVC